MLLIKVPAHGPHGTPQLVVKDRSHDFETAKRKAHKLLKTFPQVEIVDSATDECIFFARRQSDSKG